MPAAVEAMNRRLSGKKICRPWGNSSGLPILNIVGGPKVKLGTRNLKEPKPINAAGITELLQASQVKNSSRVNFRIRVAFVTYSWDSYALASQFSYRKAGFHPLKQRMKRK